MSIDCCTARLQQARPLFDPYTHKHGGQHSAANETSVLFTATKLTVNTDLFLSGSSDAACRCQYCSNLLAHLLCAKCT